MGDKTIDLQKSGMWKVQLIIAINFISSKDVDEKGVMLLKSDNKKLRFMKMEVILLMNFSSHFFQDIKVVRKHH